MIPDINNDETIFNFGGITIQQSLDSDQDWILGSILFPFPEVRLVEAFKPQR